MSWDIAKWVVFLLPFLDYGFSFHGDKINNPISIWGYHEKYTRERHARGDAKAGDFATRSRVLARLALLAQIGELARRLANHL